MKDARGGAGELHADGAISSRPLSHTVPVQVSDFVPPGTRVLDIGPSSADLARELASHGLTRYLALVPPVALPTARSDAGPLGDRFQPLSSSSSVFQCSADLLVVRADHLELLWAVHDLDHFALIAVELPSGLVNVERQLATKIGELAKKISHRGKVRIASSEFELFQIVRRRGAQTRTYFSPVWGPAGLAERLERAQLQYSVLRWFEKLPEMDPGEDLDILVADGDVDRMRELLEEEPGTMPVDLYSVSGGPHSDYQGMSYYPPHLASALLDRSVHHESGFRVPSPRDHLDSLVYHAVYHKGLRSGIPSMTGGSAFDDPEHDYRAVLKTLAASQGVDLPDTLEELDSYLESAGWRPPADTLRRLTTSNSWLKTLSPPFLESSDDGSELAVFFVRDATLRVMQLPEVINVLEHYGFDVVLTRQLDEAEVGRCAGVVRGGNWGAGPYPRSGGEPAVLIVALHYVPDEVPPWFKDQYPQLRNLAALWVKQWLRQEVESRVADDERFNPIHSSDNETEAWEYLHLVLPADVPEIAGTIAERRRHHDGGENVIRELSRGRRARVELVTGPTGEPVVRKTFTAAAARHMDREIQVMRELSDVIPAVPPVLDTGPNWFTCPYYSNDLTRLGDDGPLVPVEVLEKMVEVLRQFHAHGYDLVDARPHNFLHDRRAGLKIVDFEFVHAYPLGSRPPFHQSYNFHNTPADFTGDLPVGDQSYELRWLPFTGVPLDVLLDGTRSAKHLHRLRYRIGRLTIAPASPLRRPLGQAKRTLRGAVRRGYSSYKAWGRSRAEATLAGPGMDMLRAEQPRDVRKV